MYNLPATFFLYSSGLCKYNEAASPLSGSMDIRNETYTKQHNDNKKEKKKKVCKYFWW